MAYRTTLAEVAKGGGTVKQLAARLNMEEVTVASELLSLFSRGKVTRTKAPNDKGRAVFVYSIADEAQPQT